MSFKTDRAIYPMVEYSQKIKKLKKGSSRKQINSGAPKGLWNDCLELESYIRSNTAHGISKLDGEVTKMIMCGEMSGINQFCEFELFKWVMLRDKMALYPDDHFKLGRYLGPSINIGPAMMAKI